GDFVWHSVGDAADHHAAIGMADQNDIRQILFIDNADYVLNMRVEIDRTAEEVLALADSCQSWGKNFVSHLAQSGRQLSPHHAPGPAAMHQDERRHNFLPSQRY